MKVITYGVPEGYGYVRTGIGKFYFVPVKLERTLPDGYAMFRKPAGEPLELYSRQEVIQAIRDHLTKVEIASHSNK